MPYSASSFLRCLVLCELFVGARTDAQELQVQPTPFSAWIDLQSVGSPRAERQALPIWLESVQRMTQPPNSDQPVKTTFRVRLRRFGGLNEHFQLRLFFDDVPDAAPTVTGWSETGARQYRSPELGSGLDLPTSESLFVAGENLDYLDIAVPGNGGNLRGLFLTTLKSSTTYHALDFAEPIAISDPFANLSPLEPTENDSYLFGRVKATIASGVATLTPGDAGRLTFEFELDAIPLLAVVSFEILDADPLHPPECVVNDRPLGPSSIHLPDIADPGYQATARALDSATRFQYNGWLRGQQAIPGSVLRAGLNKLVFRLDKKAGPAAIRTVEIQFKHHWKHLDYKLAH